MKKAISTSTKVSLGDGRTATGFSEVRSSTATVQSTSYRNRLTLPEREARLGGLLRQAVQEHHDWPRRAVVAIHSLDTRSFYIELPRLTGEALQTAVHTSVSRYLGALKGLIVSYIEVPSLSPGKMGILWAASPESVVGSYLRVVQAADMQLERFAIPVLAVTRSLTHHHTIPKGRWCLVADIGFQTTTVALFRDGIPYYSRSFWLAGEKFIRAAVVGYGDSWNDAEKRKCEHDLMRRDAVFDIAFDRWLTELHWTSLYAKAIH